MEWQSTTKMVPRFIVFKAQSMQGYAYARYTYAQLGAGGTSLPLGSPTALHRIAFTLPGSRLSQSRVSQGRREESRRSAFNGRYWFAPGWLRGMDGWVDGCQSG